MKGRTENRSWRPGQSKLLTRGLLMALAILMLVPVVVTFLYSFFSPAEISGWT